MVDKVYEPTEDDLLADIGSALLRESKGLGPPSRQSRIAEAKRWLAQQAALFREKLCSNQRIRELERAKNDRLLFDAVCEVLVHLSLGVPAGCVASYLILRGLEQLCHES